MPGVCHRCHSLQTPRLVCLGPRLSPPRVVVALRRCLLTYLLTSLAAACCAVLRKVVFLLPACSVLWLRRRAQRASEEPHVGWRVMKERARAARPRHGGCLRARACGRGRRRAARAGRALGGRQLLDAVPRTRRGPDHCGGNLGQREDVRTAQFLPASHGTLLHRPSALGKVEHLASAIDDNEHTTTDTQLLLEARDQAVEARTAIFGAFSVFLRYSTCRVGRKPIFGAFRARCLCRGDRMRHAH